MKPLSARVAMLIIMAGAPGGATALDFEGLPFYPDPASVLSDQFKSEGILFGKAGVSAGVAVVRSPFYFPSSGLNSVAGLDEAGLIPGDSLGDIFFSFVVAGTTTPTTVDFVSFTIGDAGGDVDPFQIRAYDLNDVLIDVQDLSNSSRFYVAVSVAGIHRIEVDFSGDFGYSLDDLRVNTPCRGPLGDCRAAGKSLLLLKDDDTDDTKDTLLWKWLNGSQTSQAELGDPTNSADYTLCLYGGTLPVPSLLAEASVPADVTKWSEISGKGYKYKDRAGTASGVQKVLLKGSVGNRAKALLKAEGLALELPTLGSLPLPVTAQLVNTETSVCLEAVYDSGDVIKSDAKQFKAKAR